MRFSAALALALLPPLPAWSAAPWTEFEIVQWQPRGPAGLEALKNLGVTAVAVMADRAAGGAPPASRTEPPREAGLRWYIENIATDFYSPYHQFTKGKPENWRFLAAQDQYRAGTGGLERDPSLLDTSWRARIQARLTRTVASQRRYRPLYYSLGDETGIADLAAFWDFDQSAMSIAGFRHWLRGQYKSLDALNAEWGSAWPNWDAIRPETTEQAMRRGDGNFSAWNDFKAWMDTSFAESVRFGTGTIHRADPAARAGIEGTQVPGWGGYDYTKLAHAVDVMEIYDDGENLPIALAFNPRLVALATSFGADPAELHRIWREVMRGVRGLILWDEDGGIVGAEGTPGPRAAAYAPVFAELRGDPGRRLVQAEPVFDPVAILYSPVSFRTDWMLTHQPAGNAWIRASAEDELRENRYRAALMGYARALSRLGLRGHYIGPEQLAHGLPTDKVLILPQAIALSDEEMRGIRAFAARGGTVIANTPPGLYDGHGKRRAVPPDLARIVAPETLTPPVVPRFPVTGGDGFLFRSRGRFLLAIQRRTPGDGASAAKVELNGWHARDIRTGLPSHGTVALNPAAPTLLELTR